jgi:uncharacterized Fe-S radical SAM superfamily protein PflX
MSRASYTYFTLDDWNRRITELERIASCCKLCPRRCGVNRFEGERGFCAAPGELVVSSIFPHRGLCIRHLVLPNDQSASRAVLAFLKNTFDPQDVTISLMTQ